MMSKGARAHPPRKSLPFVNSAFPGSMELPVGFKSPLSPHVTHHLESSGESIILGKAARNGARMKSYRNKAKFGSG